MQVIMVFASLSLRWKILLSLVTLSVVPLAASLMIFSGVVEKELETTMQQRAEEMARFVHKTLEEAEKGAADFLRMASQDADLINSIYFARSAEEMLELGSFLEDARKVYHFDLIQVVNPEGVVIHSRAPSPEALALAESSGGDALVRDALTGEETKRLGTFGGRAAITATAPIRFHKKAIGYLAMVVLLDNDYARQVKAVAGAEIGFYSPDGTISASGDDFQTMQTAQFSGRQAWRDTLQKVPYALYNFPFKSEGAGVLMGLDRSDAVAARARMQKLFVSLLVGAALLAVCVGVAIARGVARPLREVVVNLSEIAEGEGDLTRRLEVRSSDEVGELARSFNGFLDRLQEMVRRIQVVREDLGEAALQIRVSSSQVSDGVKQQSSSIEGSHQAISAIDQSLSGVAESTGTLVNAVEESSSATIELGATIEEIAHQMENLFAAVEEVSSSIGEMSVSSQQVAENVEILASSTEITASSITEMDAAIKEIEENAEITSRLSEEAAIDAQKGKEAVDETISGIGVIREMVDGASLVIKDLGRKSHAIGKILTVIDEVADQTSLLALNAAIIAAQAGEHGKGFAVVADEIRELAQRTAVSTREISNIITGLQEGAREAVVAMEASNERVHQEVGRSRLAGEALAKIRSSTLKSTEQVRGIVRATQEQAKGSQQITGAINQVASMLGQISTAIKQQTLGIHQLAEASEAMRDIASHGKLSTSEQAEGSRQINVSMENIRLMIERIDEATREQALRSRQVVQAVSSLRTIAENNAMRSADLDRVVVSLSQQTATLKDEVGAFKA